MKPLSKLCTLTSLMAWAFLCQAQDVQLVPPAEADPEEATVKFSVFGTVGAVNSSSRESVYVAHTLLQSKGAGRLDATSYALDSKLGFQTDLKATSRLDLTVQLVSRQLSDGTYTPKVEWAFAKFALTPELDIRVGRVRPPVYMLSDYLDVNYANPWVRPPVEFYSSTPLTRIDGADLLWRPSVGDISFLIQPFYGSSSVTLTNNSRTDMDQVGGLNAVANFGDFSFRAGYAQTNMSINAPLVTPALSGLQFICGLGDPAACSAYSDLIVEKKRTTFTSLGASYDNGSYFMSGEIGKRTSESWVNDVTVWYLTGGKRFGKWTPYVTYSQAHNDSPTKFSTSSFPPTNAIATEVLASNVGDQTTLTLGVRYDIAKNIALKAQWDQVNTKTKSGQALTGNGYFGIASSTGAFPDRSNQVNLISLSLDFAF